MNLYILLVGMTVLKKHQRKQNKMKKTAKPVQSKKYFHEVIEEEEKILNIGLKMSRQHKKERLDMERKKKEDENI